jgi:hypothetical protein
MISKKDLKKIISYSLEKSTLFTTKGQSWYLDGKDSTIVVNLQKSNFNEDYFMNVGIWLKALGIAIFPSFNKCHLYFRLEKLFPENRTLILNSLSLERTNSKSLDDFSQFIILRVIPFLQHCTEEDQLKEFMKVGRFKNGIISKEAKDYLS